MNATRVVLLGLGLGFLVGLTGGCGEPMEDGKTAKVMTDAGSKGAEEADDKASADRPTPDPAGHLVVDSAMKDLGTVDPGQSVKVEFILTNDGEGTVTIVGKPGSDCGCTVARLTKNTLKPGESTTLKVTYRASKRPGKAVKKVWVNVKPPSKPRKLTMRFQATISKQVNVTPETWKFQLRDVPDNSTPLVLESTKGTPFKITGFTATGDVLALTYDPEIAAVRHELPITLDMTKLRDTPKGTVTVKTTHTKAESISVQFDTVLPFRAEPRRKVFRRVQPGKTETATLTIISNYEEEFELGEITSENQILNVTGTNKVEGGYRVTVTFQPPEEGKARVIKDTLIVGIKDRPDDSLKIQFSGIIRPAKTVTPTKKK